MIEDSMKRWSVSLFSPHLYVSIGELEGNMLGTKEK